MKKDAFPPFHLQKLLPGPDSTRRIWRRERRWFYRGRPRLRRRPQERDGRRVGEGGTGSGEHLEDPKRTHRWLRQEPAT